MSTLTLNNALSYLRMLQMPGMGAALRYLEVQIERRHFLRLFEELFPQEARDAFAKAARRAPEARFFELVEERLFPLSADTCIEALNSGELPGAMPLYTVNHYMDDWMVEGCTDNWGLAERVCQFLLTGFSDEREVLLEIGLEDSLKPISWTEWKCDLQSFQEMCAAVDPEIRSITQVLSVIEGATGNFWLDTSSEAMSYYLWDFSKETMLELAQEYKAAMEIWDSAWRVIEYINARPHLLKQLIRCWQLSLRPTPAEIRSTEDRHAS